MRISDWSSDVCSSDLEIVTTILQGRERFSAIVRYPRELRDDPHRIGTQVLVAVPGGAQVPLGELARIEVTMGAPSIRTENAMLAAYIYVDTRESDLGRYVEAAPQEHGRASCRESGGQYVLISVVAVALKKKKTSQNISTDKNK